MDYMEAERHERCPVCPKEQTHVHEVLGSVWIAEAATDPHNHRFAVVTCDVIPVGTRDHGNGRHVHFLDSVTEQNEGHRHKFRVATLIDDPIGE